MSTEIPIDIIRKYFSRVALIVEGSCLLWPSNMLNGSGYGQLEIRLKAYGGRKRILAHRASYLLANNYLPANMQVMHSCDIKRCVNPDHLRIGTQIDNEAEKVSRGRSNKGQDRWCASLTNDQAQQILDRWRKGERPRVLAEEFKTSMGVVYSILSRRKWKHLT